MSELKARHIVDVYDSYYTENPFGERSQVYLKSEVDKLISELEERIADGDKDFEMAAHQNERLLKIVRHQKYKRCLAMARWCRSRACFYDTMREDGPYWSAKSDRAYRWYKWWFKTAVQFKEAK